MRLLIYPRGGGTAAGRVVTAASWVNRGNLEDPEIRRLLWLEDLE